MEPILRNSLSDRRFGGTVIALVAAGFIAVLAAGIAASLVMIRGQEQAGWINHTVEVERHVSGVRLSLEEMRSARRGALLNIQGSSSATYEEARNRLYREIAQVERLTRDNPNQQDKVERLRRLATELDRIFLSSLDAAAVEAPEIEMSRQRAAQSVEALADAMLEEERALLTAREAAQRRSVQTFYLVLSGAGVLLLFVAIASVLVILRYTRDLARTRDQLHELNVNLEGAVQERTRDLQRANDEIQRFAYIISHDLRSPLVNVMGFTAELEASTKPLEAMLLRVEGHAPELVDKAAAEAVRMDLPEAVAFIRSSTQKMDRLINAILRLSREGRRNLSPEEVDVTGLAEAIVSGIQHVIDERGVEVSIEPEMGSVVTDRLALEQILSNLIENASKYLSPDRAGRIAVTAFRERGRVNIRVADNGRGIDPRDHERIFDLFRRSGSQDQPGEGIGLAHVRSLAYRLGGIISVESELGKGATFVVELPEQFAGDKGAAA